jgi:hypothetical protein
LLDSPHLKNLDGFWVPSVAEALRAEIGRRFPEPIV